METITAIKIENLTKRFEEKIVIENLSLEFEEGKIYTIGAPSGAGKTTLLRLIAGLDREYTGNINTMNQKIGFVFQEPSVFPWLTVKENLLFGAKIKHDKIEEFNVDSLIEELGLNGLAQFYPKQLSGGQKQRVVFGRYLMLKPGVLLCDEPFSSLDEMTKKEMVELLAKIHRTRIKTILFVTHNENEAVAVWDKAILFKEAHLNNNYEIRDKSYDSPKNTMK